MYQTKIDLNQRWPIRNALQLVDLSTRLGGLGECRFYQEYQNEPAFSDCLAKQQEMKDFGFISSPDTHTIDLSKVSDNLKYATIYLKVFHSKGIDITAVLEHQTGALNFVASDRSSLTVSGPDQKAVEDYLGLLFQPSPKKE
jgi:hypothetical protein